MVLLGPRCRWVLSLYDRDVDVDSLAQLLDRTAAAISTGLGDYLSTHPDERRAAGTRPGQFRLDLAAEAMALPILEDAGHSILSEEAGLIDRGTELVVVMDPVDGSTNASRGIPWFATSLCVVDDDGPLVALVVNLATGTRYEAIRGRGSFRDGRRITSSSTDSLSRAMVVLNGFDPSFTHWLQYRSLGATALDLCCVADGTVDASIDFSGALGPWDYLGAWLVLREAGAVIEDHDGRDLLEIGHDVRRMPVSAGNPALLDLIREERRRD